MTWPGCTVCGREDEHARWCARVRRSLAERDAGYVRQPDWPWWLDAGTPGLTHLQLKPRERV